MSIIIRFDKEPIVSQSHLKNAIGYIMKDYKTEGRVYSNSGVTAEQIIDTFLFTKKMHPTWGEREGYHWKFSFSKEETISHDKALEFIKDWAEEYLGDSYDYVVAEHSDREFTHMHLVFNSVKRTGGKYHYGNKEWNQVIKPLTNRICKKYGTGNLKEKDKKLDYSPSHTWKEIVEHDIDQCIEQSRSYKDFKIRMQRDFGYKLREGVSSPKGVYLALTPPGKGRAIRSYHLNGCTPEDIERRIEERMGKHRMGDKAEMYRVVFRCFRLSFRRLPYHSLSPYQQYFVRKVLAARRLYSRTNTTLKNHEQSVRAINRMMKDIALLYQHNIRSERDLSETIFLLEKEEAFSRSELLKNPDAGKEEKLDEQHEEIKELKRFRRNQENRKEVTGHDRRTKQQDKTITKEI